MCDLCFNGEIKRLVKLCGRNPVNPTVTYLNIYSLFCDWKVTDVILATASELDCVRLERGVD